MRSQSIRIITIAAFASISIQEVTGDVITKTKSSSPNKPKKHFFQLDNNDAQTQRQDSLQGDDYGERRVTPWVSVAVLLNFLFFFRSFAAPFFDPLGEPRRTSGSTIYFTFLAFIYIWLASVTILTVLPHISTKYNVVIATALFFYMGFMSISALLFGRLTIRCAYYAWIFAVHGGYKKRNGWEVNSAHRHSVSVPNLQGGVAQTSMKRSLSDIETRAALQKIQTFPKLMAFHRPFRRVFKSSLLISGSLCLVYAHCWSRSLSSFKASHEFGATMACRGIFGSLTAIFPSFINNDESCNVSQSCAHESLIWLLWAGPILSHLFYFALHEFSGKHHTSYKPPKKTQDQINEELTSSTSLDKDGIDDVYDDTNDDTNGEEDTNNTEWSISSTIHKFAKKIERPQDTLAMVPWFHVMLIKSAFDLLVSLHIFLGRFDARKMQVALRKTFNAKDGDTLGVFDFTQKSHMEQRSPDSDPLDTGFWFDFMSDCGDGFNSSYQVARCLAQPYLTVNTHSTGSKRRTTRTLPRGKVLVLGGDLAYPDPTPETYEERFFRTFEDAMPPPKEYRKEHISIHKPALPVKSWAIPPSIEEEKKCSDSVDVDANEKLSSYPGPVAFAIPGNHDWFDGLATYTRYILSRDWLGGWIMPQETSYFALELPRGWWVLGMDLALDNDINIEQFEFFANLAKNFKRDDNVIVVTHIPFWVLTNYEEYSVQPETNLTELMESHLNGRVRLRLAGDLHHYTRHMPSPKNKPTNPRDGIDVKSSKDPILIVAGGGGAFLHPTHCFKDLIKVGNDNKEYVRVAAFPSVNVSKHLSWMNLWQFRWRNWRLDIFWFLIYFGICSSFFPLCGVYEDYRQFNPTHTLLGLVHWAFSRVIILIGSIFVSGRVSLFFTFLIHIIIFGFTETSGSKSSTYFAWCLTHTFMHISTALLCLLFVESMAEFIITEGMVAKQDDNGPCRTDLASSLFHEIHHFAHVLDDFQLLNTTDSFFNSCRNLLYTKRFDERLYDYLSATFSWMYNESPMLKPMLEFFDLPGAIGSTHATMCSHLCANGMECLYSNNFAAFQQLDRLLVIKYLASVGFYFALFAVPIAGNVLGSWLALTLNVLKSQYNEGFSSLRLEHWKNFLRMHIDENGDLEIFSIGLARVPKSWIKDPLWDGDIYKGSMPTKPSFQWKKPSKWMSLRHSKKCIPEIIDYTKIRRRPNGIVVRK